MSDTPDRAAAPAPLAERLAQHWAVTVFRNGEEVVTIASNHLSGRELDQANEEAIRTAGQHLLAFVGSAETPTHLAALDGREAGASCWAIERDIQSRLHYWAGRNGDDWRQDNGEALRFDRRADAELMLTYHCAGIGRVVEHIWHAGLPAPPARPQPAGEAT